ncbi:hypothetical protein PRVXH_002704 [Proteinivorax hydrogeniformans]|uniref:Uncharacterized protein n=1 Tax=Proteinivorax hydrogeniformans TaxID=1826727 RepID=A0AAU8HTD3_9FIRM
MKRKTSSPTEEVAPVFSMSINEQELYNTTGINKNDADWVSSKNHLSKPFLFGSVCQGDWSNNWAPVDLIENKQQKKSRS